MDFKINFSEPIPQMIDRLKQEHNTFESTLQKVEDHIDKNNIKRAIELIRNISDLIIRHAVEEEARIMRVIMQKAKEESPESIRIMQEHNWVVDFLKYKLSSLENNNNYQQNNQGQQQGKIKNEINEFVINLRNHFSEEEHIVFPLVLKIYSI